MAGNDAISADSRTSGMVEPAGKIVRQESRATELALFASKALDDEDLERAATLALAAFTAAPDNVEVALLLLPVFRAAGDRLRQIGALDTLSTAGLTTPEQERELSGLLMTQDDLEGAIDHALHAADAEPGNGEFARHAGILLSAAGRRREAGGMLLRAANCNRNDAVTYYNLSAVCAQMEKADYAAIFADRAWEIEPDNELYFRTHVHYLLNSKQAKLAADCLTEWVESHPATADHWHLLAVAQAELKCFSAAAGSATRGLAIDPTHTGLLMHRAVVLCALGRFNEATDDIGKVLAVDPLNDAAQRVDFAAKSAAGRYRDAIPVGASILKRTQHYDTIGRSLLHILTRRFNGGGSVSLDASALVRLKRESAHLRRPRRRITWKEALDTQLRVIGALILREIRGRFGRAKLGYLWAILEPLMHISLLVAIIQIMAHGTPPIGNSFAVFYFTGIVPYHLFTHTGGNLMFAIRANRALLQLPPVTTFDVFVSRALLEIATEFAVALILMCLFIILGLDALPIDPMRFVLTFLILGACAFGVGIFNSIICAYFHSWEKIWSVSISIMYFTSGTFYIPAMMPPSIREILYWSPILQGIEMFRSSMFQEHEPPWLDFNYLTLLAFTLVGGGILAERVFRRKLLELE